MARQRSDFTRPGGSAVIVPVPGSLRRHSPKPLPAASGASAGTSGPTRTGYQPFVARRKAKPRTTYSPILVQSGQQVRMRIRGRGFEINALGQALQSGRVGEVIRLKNVDTQRTVMGTVAPDGVVEPLILSAPMVSSNRR